MHIIMCLGFFVLLFAVGEVWCGAELENVSQMAVQDASHIHHTSDIGIMSPGDAHRKRRHIGSLAAMNALRTRVYGYPKASVHRRSNYVEPEFSLFEEDKDEAYEADNPIPQASRMKYDADNKDKRYPMAMEDAPGRVQFPKAIESTPSPIRPRFLPPGILSQYQHQKNSHGEAAPRVRTGYNQHYWRHMDGSWDKTLNQAKSKKYVGALARNNAIPSSIVGFHYTPLGKRADTTDESVDEDNYGVSNDSPYIFMRPGRISEVVFDNELLGQEEEVEDVLPMVMTKRNIAALARLGLLPHARASRYNG